MNTFGVAPYSDINVSYFKGKLDDVRIYNRALSDVEVQELYEMTNDISGCFNIDGFPGTNRKVILRQNLETDQVTFTDQKGCYSFADANHAKPFSVVIQSNWTPASSPVGLQAIASTKDAVNLKWQYAPEDATSFKIFRNKGDSGAWQLLKTTGEADRTYTDATALGNDLTNTYYYLKGCNNAGCSPATESVGVPFKAAKLSAIASPGKIGLTWTDNSAIETGYRVFRKNGACSSTDAWQKLDDIAADSNAYDDTTVTPGQPYSYKVQAYYKSAAAPFAYGYALFSNCAGTATNILDQVNNPAWTGGAVNIDPSNQASQTFVPSLPCLVGVETAIETGNPGRGGDQVTLKVLAADGHELASASAGVPEGFDGFWRFDLAGGGISLSPGQPVTMILQDTGKIVFFWKYKDGNTYPAGQAFFYGSPLKNNDFFFKTYGANNCP